MLTLSLAAITAFVTIFAAILRTANLQAAGWMQPLPAGLALAGLGLLLASALWATKALSPAAMVATDLLRDPFPKTRKELKTLFGARHEDIVPDSLAATVQLHIADTETRNNFSVYAALSLVAGTILAASSLVFPLIMP